MTSQETGEPNWEPIDVRPEGMAAATTARPRGRGEYSIYLDAARGRYVGAVSLRFGSDGKRIRRQVADKTKQEVRDKLKAMHSDLDAGLRPSASHTVDSWLRHSLDGRSERTRKLDAGLLGSLVKFIGDRPLVTLSVKDVRCGLQQLTPRFSRRSLQITSNCLGRARESCPGQRAGRTQCRVADRHGDSASTPACS
jgi:hypothetical protein